MTGLKRTFFAQRQPLLLDANVNPHPYPSNVYRETQFPIPFIYSIIYQLPRLQITIGNALPYVTE